MVFELVKALNYSKQLNSTGDPMKPRWPCRGKTDNRSDGTGR
jgi:hypothetical protein